MSTTTRKLGNGRRVARRRARGAALHAVPQPQSGRNDRAPRARIRLVARPARQMPVAPRRRLLLVVSNPTPAAPNPRRTQVRPALRLVAPGERAPRAHRLGRILWSIEQWQPAHVLILAAIALAGVATIATSIRQLLSRVGIGQPSATL